MGWRELDINAGLGGGEETQLFGPRNEKGSSLYQVDTLACINPKEQDELTGCPPISSTATQAGVCLIVANHVLVFDESCSSYKVKFSFASNVDCIAWVPESNFVAIAQSSGVLNLAHIPSKKVILSQPLLSKGANQNQHFRNLVFCPLGEGLFELEILPSKGSVIKLPKIDLKSLDQAIASGDIESLQRILSQLSQEVVNVSSIHSESLNHIAAYEWQMQQKFLISGKGEFGLSVWEKEADGKMAMVNSASDYFDEDIGFLKCLFSPNEDFFIALDTEHHLSLWSTALLTPFLFYNEVKVQDFMLFSSNAAEEDNKKKDHSEELKLVILTMPEHKKSLLQVYSLPNFEHVYTLQVSGCSRLATFESQLDSIYFIEGIESDLNNDSMFEDQETDEQMDVITIRLRRLTEALPYSRFMRLLHKNKFDQAEEFAKQFDLDVEVVYALKASAIINRLEPRSKSAPKTEEEYAHAIEELKSCLNKLTDATEVVNFCLNAALPTFHATFDLLKYGKERLESKDVVTTSAPNFQSVLDGLNRLVTFEVAFGTKKFTARNWASFLNASLLDEVMNCFESDVTAAIVIWRRHQPELELGFTLSKVEMLLASIPYSTPSTKIIQWLREDFVPFVLTKVPEGQMPLARWLDARARHMEISEKENWPHNALELAEVMFKAFSDVANSNYGRGNATPAQFAMQVCRLSIPCSASDFDQTEVDEDSLAAAMTRLGDLVTCLREISSLRTEFACKLSLHCYQQENTKTIAFRLLDRVLAPELIPGTVESYVRPYAAKHNLLADDLLLAYVNDMIERKPGRASSIWHSKVISVIGCIIDQELKRTAAMQIMRTMASSWSPDVKQLANTMMDAYPHNEELRQLRDFAELKTTMLQYGIRDYGSEDPAVGHGTIHYIFQCDTESALKDAKQVMDTFQTDHNAVYFFRIMSWIMKDKVEESCSFLRSLDAKSRVNAAEKITNWAISSLEDPPLDEQDKELDNKRLKAAIEIVRTVSTLDEGFKRKHQTCLKTLQNIYALQVEYDIYISYNQYNNQQKKDETWRYFIMETKKTNEEKKLKTMALSLKAIRLAELLGFDHVARQKQEIAALRSDDNVVQVLKMLRDSKKGIPSSSHLRMLKEVLLNLLTEKWHCEKKEDLWLWLSYVDAVHRLAAFGTSLCNEDSIRDYLQISQCLRLALAVSEQCESADYRQDAFRQTDAFAKWNFTERYEDDGMVLYSNEIIPLLRIYHKSLIREEQCPVKYETQTLSGSNVAEKDIVHVCEASRRILNVLMENHLQSTALQFILQLHGALIQNTSSCDMGFAIPTCLEEQVRSNQILIMENLEIASKAALDMIQNLYVKVLTHRQIDHDLALAYLCAMPHQKSLQAMASLKDKFATRYRRMEVAALVGVDYAGLIGDPKLLGVCQDLQNAAYWGKKFVSLKIPFDDVYKLTTFGVQQKGDIVKLLVTNRNITLSTLQKFCQTFVYDEDVALFAYIKNLLLPQQGSVEDPAYKDKVLEAIPLVTSSDNLYKMLRSVFDLICPYDYEKLSLVLSQMAIIEPSSTEQLGNLLEQLYSYERCSLPSEYELSFSSLTEDEQLLRGCTNLLPEISKVRLPFRALIGVTPWKILSPELKSEAAARKLENVVKCLELDINKLYATTIHNIVNSRLQTDGKTNAIPSNAKKADFQFSEVKGLLASIIDPELAIAAAHWVAKLLPVGEEKVKVLKTCVQLCKPSETAGSEKESQKMKDSARRLNDLCKRIEVEALLLKHGIEDEQYKNMTNQPEALIEKLYEDYGCKGEILNGRVVGIPNIHEIAEEISIVNQTNLSDIHHRLLEKWLPSSNISGSSVGGTTLMDASMMIPEEGNSQEDEKNLKRVIYILNKRTQSINAEFLLHFVFKESSTKVTHLCRIRAMQALFALVSSKTIEAYSGADSGLENIRLHLTSLVYLADLEALHLPQSISHFNRCDKAGLVRGLWRNHSHEPKGVRLIADLCLDNQIYDVQLWNILLPQLLSFGMIDYLRHILVALSAVPGLREIPCLAKMWRSVILAPFSSASIPLSEEEEFACLEAASLLQRCPVILDLNLQDIANRYQRIGMFTQALLCLTLIPENTIRERCLERLIEDVGCFVILDKVESERNREKFEGHLDRVQEEVFAYVNKKKMYQDVVKSAYFKKFIAYLASSCQLNDLIMETIINRRFNDAIQLVQFYDKFQPHSPAGRSKKSELKGVQRLMVYLKDSNLFDKAAAYLPDFQANDAYI